MGFVRIETVTNKSKKFSMEIESAGLYTINCLWGRDVEFLDKVLDICITDDFLLVRTEDRDFRNGAQSAPWVKDNCEENNINAFDWKGNHLWNIGELVGDIKMAFDGITHITPTEAKQEYGIRVKKNTQSLFSCISGGFVFIIDAQRKKMIYKASGKAK